MPGSNNCYLLDLLVQLIVMGVLVIFASHYVADALTPRTDIDVTCHIDKSQPEQPRLAVSFNNQAKFAGDTFHIYIWGNWTESGSGGEFHVYEQCKRIQSEQFDYATRFHFLCEFIPPQSNSTVIIDLPKEEPFNAFSMEWWGKTTPYKEQIVSCT